MEKEVQLPKGTYENIVRFTLESMLDLSKQDKAYILEMDILHYYKTTIEKDAVISKEDFKMLCKEKNIPLHCYIKL